MFSNGKTNNHFGMCMFNKNIQYENAFSKHLDYRQSEQWLVSNKYRVNQVIDPMKRLITSKYGNPFKNAENDIIWRDSKGNIIQIIVNRITNIFQQDENATRQWGCIPTYTITLIYVEGSNVPNF